MYNYETEKPTIFTEQGQRTFLSIRDQAITLAKLAGCVRMDRAISGVGGDSWTMMACVDRMVELAELREITQGETAGQYRVFVMTGRMENA